MESSGALHGILERVAERMRLDFEESAAIKHRSSKGTVRERDVQRDFLEKYLPSVARVTGSGELVSADGQVSSQCDLMIVDVETPPLWAAEDYAIVPVECCYALVEVKSNLTVEELRKSWAAAKTAKALPRTAYLNDPSPFAFTRTAYGQEWPHAFPIRSVVFAYGGATLDTLAKEMSLLAQEDPNPAMGIDALCVLNRGIVSWQVPSTGATFERQPDSMAFASETSPGDVLLFLAASLNDVLANARYNQKFNIKGYISRGLGSISTRWKDGQGFRHVPVGGAAGIVVPVDAAEPPASLPESTSP